MADRDHCLKRRLLFACRGTYHPELAGFREPVQWQSGPDLIEDPVGPGDRLHIDAALVGRVEEGVVVAFRGTLPPFVEDSHAPEQVFADWLNNLDFRAVADPLYPGMVHEGFAASVARLWAPLEAAILRHLDEAPQRRLFITGHSKGGALANLAAWRALGLPNLLFPIRVFTIAAARAGNEAWRAACQAERRIVCSRYESALDVVPWVPFGRDTPGWVRALLGNSAEALASVDYVPVGTRILETDSWTDRLKVFARAARFLIQPKKRVEDYIQVLGVAHEIGTGSGYDSLVCEPACGPAHHI